MKLQKKTSHIYTPKTRHGMQQSFAQFVARLDLAKPKLVSFMSFSEEGGDDAGRPKLCLDGLQQDWEKDSVLRKHLRTEGMVLFPKSISESVKSCEHEHVRAILTPLLHRTANTPGKPQPGIDGLKEEVGKLYEACGVMPDEVQVCQDAWMIRKFLTFIKMKVRTQKVSTVSCRYIFGINWWGFSKTPCVKKGSTNPEVHGSSGVYRHFFW